MPGRRGLKGDTHSQQPTFLNSSNPFCPTRPEPRGSSAMRWSSRTPKLRRRSKMQVEVLEDRQLLATITVNTAADPATPGTTMSLREAIEVSNGTLAVSSLSTQQQAQVSGASGIPTRSTSTSPRPTRATTQRVGCGRSRPMTSAGDQHERGDHQRQQPAGGEQKHPGAGRQRETGHRDQW